MRPVRRKIEALPFFYRVNVFPEMQSQTPGYDISELLAFMGLVLLKLLSRSDGHQQRFHLVLLGIRHYPPYAVARFVDLLGKRIL